MRALVIAAGVLAAGAASADELRVEIELPRMSVAEYHRPYVALWIARPDQSVVSHLDVWYQQEDGPEGAGETWLVDIRQWWRRIGRTLELDTDGVSRPTRPPGQHTISYQLPALPPGDYLLNVEAAREVGGRELIGVPFRVSSNRVVEASAQGENELGAINMRISR